MDQLLALLAAAGLASISAFAFYLAEIALFGE